ncbi:hypothetical protein BDN71DRAFT_1435167 [Pleurotus eryngii]|uniref:Uncharacterized protein n=1 Tax=Pleurotus eryngii TaxID=5323 RepID=A0A9P5ZNZ5_PLEER|nr:hypothetical protein BDN71DRAFT_1435167 [Pleurotus eryngii]
MSRAHPMCPTHLPQSGYTWPHLGMPRHALDVHIHFGAHPDDLYLLPPPPYSPFPLSQACAVSLLEVALTNRMMAIVADGQEAAALFDIYEAIIYKEADNMDKAEMQQNTTELDNKI